MTRTENVVKFEHVVLEISRLTDKQIERHTDVLIAILPTGGKVTAHCVCREYEGRCQCNVM